MSKFVRFVKPFEFWPTPSVLMVFEKGEEKRITEAQYEAANAAGAVELLDGESAEQGTVAAETGGDTSGDPKGNGRRARR